MKKKEYVIPVTKIKEIVISKVIAQSYGPKGAAAAMIEEEEITGW